MTQVASNERSGRVAPVEEERHVRSTQASWRRRTSWIGRVAVVGACAATIAACGGDSDSDSGSKAAADGGNATSVGEGIKGAEQVKPGGTLKVGLPAPPASLDPTLANRGGNYIYGTFSETLTQFDDEGKLSKDGLLTDWERTGRNSWKFTVREGVKFHNGEPFDAEAAKFTILAQRDVEGSILKTYFLNIKDVDVIDPTTIEVKTTTPQFNVPDQLGTVYALPPKAYKKAGADFAKNPIGTGPFVYASQKAGVSISVKANPDYWRGAPKLEGIEFSFPKDASQRLALVQSGALDLAFELAHQQGEQAASSGLQVLSVATSLKEIAFIVGEKAPFDDPKVREAAALAIDRNEIVEGIFGGTNVAEGGLLNMLPGQKVPEIVEPNIEKAKELLAGTSPEIDLSWIAGYNTGIEEVTSAMRAQLEKAGFKVKPNPIDQATLIKQAIGREFSGIWLYGAVPNVPDPNFYVQGFMTKSSISGNCVRPAWDKAATEALEAKDAAAAQSIYDDLNTQAVVDQHCYVPLYFETSHFAAADKVGGFKYSVLRYSDFYEAGFTE